MTRALAFIFRNWPLKLAAILLATVLYAGLVLSQNARTWSGQIAIEVLHQPASAFILGPVPPVTSVRYFAPSEVGDRVTSASFTATIDLANASADPDNPATVIVDLRPVDGSINVLDWSPRRVAIRLDRVIERPVPVTVNHGTVPEGLQIDDAQLSTQTVMASGPESVVNQVAGAEARVQIQSSGIDVDQLVDLVAVDGRDEVLTPVDLTPSSVRVRIPVGTPITTKTMPVAPVVTGTPANGFEVASAKATPIAVTLRGSSSTLADLTSVSTLPVDIDGTSATTATSVALDVPEGLTPVGADTVRVTVTLRPSASTRNFTVGLIVVGANSGRTYAVGVDAVVVTLGGGNDALSAVDASSFAASINVSDLGAGSHTLPVRLAVPAGLKLISISPSQVEVIVSPRVTPPPAPTPTAVPATPVPTESPAATP